MSPERQPCPNHGVNDPMCTCPKSDCPRHGVCCACVQNHLGQGNLPQCLRGMKK